MNLDTEALSRTDIAAHVNTLLNAVLSRPGAWIVELGTRFGNSTSIFIHGSEKVGGRVWSVDNNFLVPSYRCIEWIRDCKWTPIVDNDLSEWAKAQTPGAGEIDILFIDTCHAYEHTLKELREYGARVKPGGVIFLHDTDLQEVSPCPLCAGSENPDFPVRNAIEKYCAEAGIMTWFNHDGSYGLGQIDIPATWTINAEWKKAQYDIEFASDEVLTKRS